jgi:rhodanese-related sulfurtransferase
MSFFSFFDFRAAGSDDTIVSHDEMVKLCDDSECVVIDVRELQEFRSGHIAGSLNVPLSSFHPSRVPTDKPVVLICLSGARSAGALKMLRSAGHQNVRHYKAGIAGWRMQGGKLV